MRTGAIFARGSCRALRWMALFGVVFALGGGEALAQTAMVDLEANNYSDKIVEVKLAQPVWGDVPSSAFSISGNNVDAVMGLSTASPGSDTFQVSFLDTVARADILVYAQPSDLTRALKMADGIDSGTEPDNVAGISITVTEEVNRPVLPAIPTVTVDINTAYVATTSPAATLPSVIGASGVGTVSYTILGLPVGLSANTTDSNNGVLVSGRSPGQYPAPSPERHPSHGSPRIQIPPPRQKHGAGSRLCCKAFRTYPINRRSGIHSASWSRGTRTLVEGKPIAYRVKAAPAITHWQVSAQWMWICVSPRRLSTFSGTVALTSTRRSREGVVVIGHRRLTGTRTIELRGAQVTSDTDEHRDRADLALLGNQVRTPARFPTAELSGIRTSRRACRPRQAVTFTSGVIMGTAIACDAVSQTLPTGHRRHRVHTPTGPRQRLPAGLTVRPVRPGCLPERRPRPRWGRRWSPTPRQTAPRRRT